jgi:hypothetical protein
VALPRGGAEDPGTSPVGHGPPPAHPCQASLPDDEKAQYLLDHPTLSDRTWTNEPRLKGEKRDAFIRRILLGA